jgi:hypothetical protein
MDIDNEIKVIYKNMLDGNFNIHDVIVFSKYGYRNYIHDEIYDLKTSHEKIETPYYKILTFIVDYIDIGLFDKKILEDYSNNKEMLNVFIKNLYQDYKGELTTLTWLHPHTKEELTDEELKDIEFKKRSIVHCFEEIFNHFESYDLSFKFNLNEHEKKDLKISPIYPETTTKVDFIPIIFKDEYSVQLFNYLIDRYHNGKDKELSNIYQWMENNNFIHQSKRQEYKKLVADYNITKQKYSRVHSSTEYEPNKVDPSLNELKKRFDKETKQ